MNYSIKYYRYYILGGTSLNYWGSRQPVLGEPLGRNTLMDYLLETVRTLKASLVKKLPQPHPNQKILATRHIWPSDASQSLCEPPLKEILRTSPTSYTIIFEICFELMFETLLEIMFGKHV